MARRAQVRLRVATSGAEGLRLAAGLRPDLMLLTCTYPIWRERSSCAGCRACHSGGSSSCGAVGGRPAGDRDAPAGSGRSGLPGEAFEHHQAVFLPKCCAGSSAPFEDRMLTALPGPAAAEHRQARLLVIDDEQVILDLLARCSGAPATST